VKRTVLLAAAAVLVLAAAGAGWWLSRPPAKAPEIAAAERAALIDLGQRVYADNCARCHGPKGEGQANWRQRKADGRLPAPPLNGSGHTWHHPDEHLFAVVSQGVEALAPAGYASDMRGFGDKLSDREIRAVLAYVKDWWPADIRARQRDITARARQSRN